MRRLVPLAVLLLLPSCRLFGASNGSEGGAGDLVGQEWVLTSLELGETGGIPGDQRYSISFDESGAVSGQVHCNRYSGPYELPSDGQIEFGNMASTRAYCGGQSLDQTYHAALRQVETYEVRGRRLVLSSGSTVRLTFVAAP